MKNNIFLLFVLLFVPWSFIVAQDNVNDTLKTSDVPAKQLLCRKWLSVSYMEDGKKGNDFYFFVEFLKNGRYVYIEDDLPIKEDTWAETGTWELLNDNVILFDKGTDDEDRMNIVSINDKALNVNYSFDKVLMNITFVPGNYK